MVAMVFLMLVANWEVVAGGVLILEQQEQPLLEEVGERQQQPGGRVRQIQVVGVVGVILRWEVQAVQVPSSSPSFLPLCLSDTRVRYRVS
jgi:hypothetical protein